MAGGGGSRLDERRRVVWSTGRARPSRASGTPAAGPLSLASYGAGQLRDLVKRVDEEEGVGSAA
jgi:hypothetical protein